MSHSGKAPGKEAKKETKERSPNLGGRRPGAGRPKGSKYGKRRHFMCYLNSEDAEKFEWFAAIVGMSPYMLLKDFAKAAITDGLRKIAKANDSLDDPEQPLRLMFHVGVDFDMTLEPGEEGEDIDPDNGVFFAEPQVWRRRAVARRTGARRKTGPAEADAPGLREEQIPSRMLPQAPILQRRRNKLPDDGDGAGLVFAGRRQDDAVREGLDAGARLRAVGRHSDAPGRNKDGQGCNRDPSQRSGRVGHACGAGE